MATEKKKPHEETKKLSEMTYPELANALNGSHNRIHAANQQILVNQQNIMSIMTEIENRKDGK